MAEKWGYSADTPNLCACRVGSKPQHVSYPLVALESSCANRVAPNRAESFLIRAMADEADKWLEKRANPSRMNEAIRSLACVAQRRPDNDRRVSIPLPGEPATPQRRGFVDAQGIADAVLVSGAAAAS